MLSRPLYIDSYWWCLKPMTWFISPVQAGKEGGEKCKSHTGTWEKWQNTTTSVKAQQINYTHRQQSLGQEHDSCCGHTEPHTLYSALNRHVNIRSVFFTSASKVRFPLRKNFYSDDGQLTLKCMFLLKFTVRISCDFQLSKRNNAIKYLIGAIRTVAWPFLFMYDCTELTSMDR